MKRYIVNWHFFNMFEDSQKEVVRLQMMWKGFIGLIAGSTYAMSSPEATLIIGVVGYIVDQLIMGFWFVPKDNLPSK